MINKFPKELHFILAFHPDVYVDIKHYYKPNCRPTQLFIEQTCNICGGEHVSAPFSEPSSGLTEFPKP
jgi:hypothetical protein